MSKREPETKQEVIKHSAAIQIENNISLLQRIIWNALLYNAYPDLDTEEEHRITLRDLARLVGYDSHDMEYLKKAAKAMLRCLVEWDILDKDGSPEWGVTALLAQLKINRGVCTYAYSPELRRRLHNPVMYARLDLQLQRQFDSKYALTLWELCTDYLGAARAYGETPFIPVEDFRKIMGVEKNGYPKFKEFNRCVIKEPVEDINTVSDFRVSVDYRREGRKVTAIKFKMNRVALLPKSTSIQGKLFPELEDAPVVVKELTDAGLAPQEAGEIWQQGYNYVHEERRPAPPEGDEEAAFIQYIREKIHLLKRRQASGKVENATGFLLQAIRENYANPEFQQELGRKNAALAQQARREREQQMKVLERQKGDIEKIRDKELYRVGMDVAEASPAVLDQAVAAEKAKGNGFGFLYDESKDALENYRSRPLLAGLLRAYLVPCAPERFAAVEQRYEAQLADLNAQIAALQSAETVAVL